MSSTEPATDNTVDDNKSITAEPDSETPVQQKVTEKKPKAPTRSRAPSFIFLLFFIILLAVSGAGYYYWQQLQITLNLLSSELNFQAKQINHINPSVKKAQGELTAQQQQLKQLTEQYQLQLNKLAEFNAAQQTMMQSMQNVFDITHRNQRQWLLAEVSYLLSLANQRLLVSRDIASAVAALKSANNRLHDLADPSLLKLRKQISEETAALNLLKQPDINGIAFTLDNSLSLIRLLPFKSARQKNIEGSNNAQTIELTKLDDASYFSPLWERIKSLITIKKHSREIQSTETVLEKSDIDSQLGFRIEAARLALINKNTKIFNHEILSAAELLSLYYDHSDNRVAALENELKSYSKINLQPSLPDITASWKMLQTVIAINDATINTGSKSKKGKSIQ